MKALQYLNKYFLKYKYRLLLGVVFIILTNVCRTAAPRVIGNAIDEVVAQIEVFQAETDEVIKQGIKSAIFDELVIFVLIILGIALTQGAFLFLTRQTIIVMSRLIELDLRDEIYAHYQSLTTRFYKLNRTGDLMSRIVEDVNKVRMYLGPAIMYTINLTFLIILAVASMIQINAELTMYVLLPLPILVFSIYYVNNLINKWSERIQRKLSDLTTIAQETFSGIRVIKSYAQETYTSGFFKDESEAYKVRSLKLARIEALFFPLMVTLIGCSTLLAIYLGGLKVIDGEMTAGNIAEFVLYVNLLTWPVTAIGWVASIIQRASASQKRINEFLSEEAEIRPDEGSKHKVNGGVRFDNVSFTYPETGVEALKNVSFSISPGEKWAIIGRTGSGKSTVAELAMRSYDPDSGNVWIDDQKMKNIHLGDYREQVGYVPQDVFLFSDTIENNIKFGLANLESRFSAEEAAKIASIDDEIRSFPEGFQTIVGERGVTLSGGQKQRISIARAMIKDPSIIWFDDCLSAVDATTEERILNNLQSFLEGRTAVVITHRVFSLLDFDQILVIDEGRVVEQGTHDELLEKGGLYSDLYRQQQEDQAG